MAILNEASIEALPATNTEIEIGSTNYLSVVWRLTRMELYKLLRHRYSKVLLIVLLALLIIITSIFAIFIYSRANAVASSFAPRQCTQSPNGSSCRQGVYTQTQLEKFKTGTLQEYARTLGLPGSFGSILSIWGDLGMLGVLLFGPLLGTEYVLGTIRLLFTRGPSRLQCMLGKIFAGLIYIAGVLLLFTVVYMALGMLLYPVSGQPYSYAFGFFNSSDFASTLGTDLLVGLIVLGYWFIYGMLSFFFGTLGRSTAAAIGGAFGWYIVETIIGTICTLIQNSVNSGTVHDLAKNLPDYFIGNNFSALISNRSSSSGSITDTHALIVVGVSFVLLIGGSLALTLRRDVTD